jgi:hypothetical protein
MKFSRWFLASLLVLFLVAPAVAQFNPGCGAGFCGLQSAGGGGGSAFNAGRSQIGVNFLQFSNDFAFMNAMKGASSWGYVDNSAIPDPTELSTNGYPLVGANAFSHGGVKTVFYVPLPAERPGNYVATWDGISNLFVGMTNTVLPSATFTGSVTAGILTAGAPSATIQKGMQIATLGGVIGDQITGSAGAAGTYSVTGLTTAISQSMTINGGSKTGSAATGNRYVFSTTDYAFSIGFTAATQTPSNLRVFHVDDEAELDAGQVLGKKFRTVWAYMNAGVIRFGDWMTMNQTNQTTWATRKPVNYVFYSGTEYRLSMWAGTTTNVGDAYTAPLTPSGWTGLVDKATVIVKFNASASGDSATLNVAGTGAVVIRSAYGDATSAGANTRVLASRFGTLVYDATLNAWLKYGGDTADGNQALSNGVPPEMMLTIATKLGAHPYINTPYLAADPLTDYMPSLATYLRDTAPSWMIPRFEGTNETWNSAAGFYATRYGWNKAFAYWGVSNDNDNWYGKEISLLGQAISAVYSGNRARYQVLAGVRSSAACGNASCSVSATSGSDTRLTSALWISSGPSQSGYSNTAGVGEAYRWVTHVAMANYVTPTAYGTLQELRDGYAYVVTNAGNPSAQATLADAYADALGGAAAIFNLNYVKAMAGHWYTWAQSNWGGSIKLPLTAYEGGYSPDYSNSIWTSPITGATRANPCVLTLATTDNPRGSGISGNPAVIGMSLSIAGVVGMTQLNGNTYTVTAVAGNSVTINVDASAFTAYTSGGTSSYVNSPLYTNTLRWASKFSTHLQTQMTQHYTDMAAVPMVFPSQFNFSGPSVNEDNRVSGGTIGDGQVWGLYDQGIYATPYSPAVESIRLFNQ